MLRSSVDASVFVVALVAEQKVISSELMSFVCWVEELFVSVFICVVCNKNPHLL